MPEVIFNGPEGRLEGRYYKSKLDNPPLAMFLHPNPQHGGTMNSKIVYLMYHIFLKNGFSTLRFNFRGVGRSQGSFDNGEGELADAAAALDWVQSITPNMSGCWIGGFSFGAWIGMQLLMRRPEIDGFISISPPANMYDFSFLAPCPSNGLIVQGTNDDIVTEGDVAKLAKKLSSQKGLKIDYRKVDGADHFFTDKLDILKENIESYMQSDILSKLQERGAA